MTMTLYDNHIHILNEATTPPAIAAGRWRIDEADMRLIMGAAKTLRAIDWPDEIDAAGAVVGAMVSFFPHLQRIRHLIALYFMDTAKQVRVIRRMLRENRVAGANVLVVPGTPAAGVRAVIEACAGTELRVFAPVEWAGERGVCGIKHYPSMAPRTSLDVVAAVACVHGLPVISHCSPAGARSPDVSATRASALNLPGRWLDAVRDRPVRLCLAHGGGAKWARWVARPQHSAWALDYMTREACPPTEWEGRLWVDTAFHEDQGSDLYRRAVQRAVAPWRVLWGSDWPLHLPLWSYEQACAWGRQYWGDQVQAQREFAEGDA